MRRLPMLTPRPPLRYNSDVPTETGGPTVESTKAETWGECLTRDQLPPELDHAGQSSEADPDMISRTSIHS